MIVRYLGHSKPALYLFCVDSRFNAPSVSLSFHLAITQEVLSAVAMGHPTPDDIIVYSDPAEAGRGGAGEEDEPIKKLTIETSPGDVRLWVEIMRNLTKDLSKHQSIQLPDSVLASLQRAHQPREAREEDTANLDSSIDSQRHNSLVVFSCGHAYALDRFQNQILLEFVERVQDFPLAIPQTLKQLQTYYKQCQCYPSACPHCVFQYLRKFQMEECPKVPIKPWKL